MSTSVEVTRETKRTSVPSWRRNCGRSDLLTDVVVCSFIRRGQGSLDRFWWQHFFQKSFGQISHWHPIQFMVHTRAGAEENSSWQWWWVVSRMCAEENKCWHSEKSLKPRGMKIGLKRRWVWGNPPNWILWCYRRCYCITTRMCINITRYYIWIWMVITVYYYNTFDTV